MVLDAVSAQLGAAVPAPGIAGPFSLGDADRLAAILRGADLIGVSVRELAVPLRAASFEEWWKRTSALVGPALQDPRVAP
jgi:enediyne biosynthesis protein CalE5